MDTLYTGPIAVVGTLLGSVTTHVLQRKVLSEQTMMVRNEKLRSEQLASCGAFAAALTDLKRAVVTLWFRRRDDPESEEARLAWLEADQSGATAEAARFTMLLLATDPSFERLADDAFAAIDGIGSAADRSELVLAEQRFADAVQRFIRAGALALR